MPEAPDLEVVKDFLQQRLRGQTVVSACVTKPIVLRSLATGDFSSDIAGHSLIDFQRRGKFLLVALSGERLLVINPMLAGGLQYCLPSERVAARTCIILTLSAGRDLRYVDDKQMGKVYYLEPSQISAVPKFEDQGPDALDDGLTLEEFKQRLQRYHGEIKGIITRGNVIAGIGNAYADEVLFAAGLSPFRKRRSLSPEEVERLYRMTGQVLKNAIEAIRSRIGEEIHVKHRDFLRVHGKGDSPCPRCGAAISTLTANRRLTNWCRHCQPGALVRN